MLATSLCFALVALQTPQLTPTQVSFPSQAYLEYAGWSLAWSDGVLAAGTYASKVHLLGEVPGGWELQHTITGPATPPGFGQAVGLDGDTLVVGADASGASGGEIGKVYVYRYDGSGWYLEASLLGEPVAQKSFGRALAIQGDTLVVGAPDFGAFPGEAYVYTRTGTSWDSGELLVPSTPSNAYGQAVALDGDTVLIGAPIYNGYYPVTVFERSGGEWVEQAALDPPPGTPLKYGWSLAVLGDEAVVGARGFGTEAGAAFAYRSSGGSWSLVQQLVPSTSGPGDVFGNAVGLSPDVLAVSALETGTSEDRVFGFRRDQGAWSEAFVALGPGPTNPMFMGRSLAVQGQVVAAASPTSGLGSYFFGGTALEYDPDLGELVAMDAARRLVVARPGYASSSLGFMQGGVAFSGLAYDESAGVFFGSNWGTDELWQLDPTSWTATLVGTLSAGGIRALASTPYGLYGLDNKTDQLVTIATGTGLCTPVGALGFDKARGLAWDPNTETLYACNTTKLYTVDRTTGHGTLLGALGSEQYEGLTFDPVAGMLYGLRDVTVYAIDPLTLTQTPWEPIYLLSCGVIYTVDAGQPLAYCTAGTSASGCAASISGSGAPSATQPSGFDLVAAGVEGSKRGLFFFGISGRQAAPWGNSTSYQCVVPPVVRTPLQQESGTSGLCDGLQALDLNAWFQAKPAANPGAGQLVQAQFWYRDPFATTNVKTSMSDALEFLVAP